MRHFNSVTDPILYACSCGDCDDAPTTRFLNMLDDAREYAGVPFAVNSGPRCEGYNALVGGSEESEHLTGEAADIDAPTSRARNAIIRGAIQAGFTRIGIGSNFVHLGCSEDKPQNVMWVY